MGAVEGLPDSANRESAFAPGSTAGFAPGSTAGLATQMARCADLLIATAQAAEWRGADPYDGLYWRWPRCLLARPRGRQAIVQLHARAPVDARALRRGPRPRIAKTLALFARAALLAGEVLGSDQTRAAGVRAVQLLCDDTAAGDRAWGYPFAVQTRWSGYPANAANIVVSAFAIDALLLAADRLGEEAFAARASGGAEWIVGRLRTARGHFAYHEHSEALIHNANLLGAAAAYRALGDARLVSTAVELTLDAQRPDGSFPYGEGSGLGFVDNFHTAYVLGALIALRDLDGAIDVAVQRGARYWSERFFDARGRAQLWPGRRFPEDGHSSGTALSTLALLASHDSTYRPLLLRVAERTLEAMVRRGRAVHRRYAWGRTHVPYLRWCDGHVALGMASCAASKIAAAPG